LEASDYLSVIRSRKWLIIWTVIIVAVGAVVVSLLQPSVYQGTATLLYTQANPGAAILGVPQPQATNFPDIELATQVSLIEQPQILQDAIRALGLDTTPEKLLQRVTIAANGQTDIITITALGSTPRAAVAIANAIATAYAAWSRDANQKSIGAAAAEVQRILATTELQVAALEAFAAARPTAANEAALGVANGRYSTLSSQLQQLQMAKVLETGSVSIPTGGVEDPVPVSPQPVRNGALGFAVGLVLGLGVALLANMFDSTVKSAEEVAILYNAPVIGQIPECPLKKNDPRQPIVLADPASPVTESYRGLRNSFEFIDFDHSIKTLLVTSAVPQEGKSTVAANLAVTLAQTGWNVALVVIDFRRPAAEESFGLERSPGLSEVLAGTSDLAQVVRRPIEGLRVVPSGEAPPNPNELLSSSAMQRVLVTLSESADLIVVDAPPLLAVADAATAARWADAALVVTREGLTTRGAVQKARQQLDGVGERVIGVVVTGVRETGATRSGYNVYSGYSSHK
jgi:capsular exopolysaccharide synthesis family protein